MAINEKHQKAGFTLLELVIVTALLALVFVGVTQLLAATLAGSGKSRSLQIVKENGQFAILTMERTVRRARRVVTCTGGPTATAAVDVRETGGLVTYTFRMSGTRLLKDVSGGPGGIPVVATDVRVDAFTCTLSPGTGVTPAVVELQLTLSKAGAVDVGVLAQVFETTVSLRSY